LGAGITLVSETLSKEKRGYGTMIVAVIGLLGAVAAAQVGKHDWRICLLCGRWLRLSVLLLLRLGTFESGMFKQVEEKQCIKG
jgi:putative MFS transporter